VRAWPRARRFAFRRHRGRPRDRSTAPVPLARLSSPVRRQGQARRLRRKCRRQSTSHPPHFHLLIGTGAHSSPACARLGRGAAPRPRHRPADVPGRRHYNPSASDVLLDGTMWCPSPPGECLAQPLPPSGITILFSVDGWSLARYRRALSPPARRERSRYYVIDVC
jgi:hypothetical protein